MNLSNGTTTRHRSQCTPTVVLTALEWYSDIRTGVSVYFVFSLFIKSELVVRCTKILPLMYCRYYQCQMASEINYICQNLTGASAVF